MRSTLLFVTLSVAAAAAPRSPSAPKATVHADAPSAQRPLSEELTGVARVAYESGRLLLEAEDSATAHAKFKEAYELSRSPRLLWNMAACSKLQRRYALALQELEQFIRDGQGQITAEQEARAKELLETLRVVVAPITIRVTPPGATLFVDGEPFPTTSGEAHVLADVGRHEYRAVLEAHTTAVRSIDLRETKPVVVELALARIVPDARLMVATIGEAVVEVDGQPFSVGSREAVLAPGVHGLRVLARDYRPWAAEVSLGIGEQKSIVARLEPEPKPNWWVIGSGAVVALAGLGVGAYYLFKPEAPAAPPPIVRTAIPGSVGTIPLP